MKTISTFIFCLISFFSFTQNCMDIGTNLDVLDAGIFKDLKMSSSHFYTRNSVYIGDNNDWDSELATTMPQDEAGYPLAIPFPHPTTGNDQIIAFTIGGHFHNYQTGNYVLLYEGEGTIEFANWTANTVTSNEPGRIEFTIDAVNEDGIHIEIYSSENGNHIRNIRIVQDIYESNYQTQPYLPNFEELISTFKTLRFMDWAFTNNHPISNWTNRTSPNFHTQAIWEQGVAWEHLIDLANYFQKDIWINVPHLANENYSSQMATLFRNELNEDLTIYLEYSNECWNWIFDQTHWLNENGPFAGNVGTNYGYYTLEMLETWEAVFFEQENRLKTVLAGHDYFVIDAMEYIKTQSMEDLVDLVSYPGYVALSDEHYDQLDVLGSDATAEQIIEMLNDNVEPNFYWMNQFKELVADEYNKEFVMYEAGQHLTPRWFGLDAPYNQALWEAQVHPGMGEFYENLLNYCQNDLEVKLLMHFNLASPQESTFGSWGLVENHFATAPYAPKMQTVLDWQNENPCNTTSTEEVLINSNIEVFPNPATNQVSISWKEQNGYEEILLLDIHGRQLFKKELTPTENTTNIQIHYPRGIYFVQLNTSTQTATKRLIIQ